MTGYTATELDDIQAKWSLRFPPDLLALLRERRSVIPGDSFDWITSADADIQAILDWPLESFIFDVDHGYWWCDWGPPPESMEARHEQLRALFAAAPKLIPVFGHRYLPETPHESGNPVFSVYQMDVITYGANLEEYIRHELEPSGDGPCPQPGDPRVKHIAFWTRAVEINNCGPYGVGQPPPNRTV